MLVVALLICLAWLLTGLLVVGLCRSAAVGDGGVPRRRRAVALARLADDDRR